MFKFQVVKGIVFVMRENGDILRAFRTMTEALKYAMKITVFERAL